MCSFTVLRNSLAKQCYFLLAARWSAAASLRSPPAGRALHRGASSRSTTTSTAAPSMSSSLPGADQAADGEHEHLVCLASWAASLAEHNPTWRSLRDEKQHGWASAALDWCSVLDDCLGYNIFYFKSFHFVGTPNASCVPAKLKSEISSTW